MAKLLPLKTIADLRGALGVAPEPLPFDVKRIYFIWPAEDCTRRGGHRHKMTRQILFCTTGSCSVKIVKHGFNEIFHLAERQAGLLLEPEDWHEMYDFSDNCALTVLASLPYDASDYISEPCL